MIGAVTAAGLSASAAVAGDKPLFGPPPAWVRALPAPSGGDKPGDAAVRILLADQQSRMEAGRTFVYVDVVYRIDTPQGLAVGNISLPWQPDTSTLTVHRIEIRRGDKIIDVLASGQTFTVARRETNLDSAALDGVLTANLQPEGLQVGDVLEMAATVASSDPTLKDHVEQTGGAWNVLPVARAHLRVEWPTSLPIRFAATDVLSQPQVTTAGGVRSLELGLSDIEPLNLPKGAPARFGLGRLVELTDYSSWSALAAAMAPLYTKAATLPAQGALVTELERLRAASSDPLVRAEGALALVQDRVRYVALAMGAGGLTPADAETTWARRFGDCKGKTALLLGLLHALGIAADAVIVSTRLGDGLEQRLPLVGWFDHVLVRATIGGRTYWLDGTRTGDTRLDALQVPPFGWGLPLASQGATLVRMLPPALEEPSASTTLRIDASAGLTRPAPTTAETLLRGDTALAWKLAVANLTPDARDRGLREFWKGVYDFVEIKTTAATFDEATGVERLSMTGDATLDWSGGSFQFSNASVGFKGDFSRQPGPHRDAPFAVPYPVYTQDRETLVLPPGVGQPAKPDKVEVDQTVGGVAYRRHAAFVGSSFTVETSTRSLAPEFPSAEAPAAQAALRALYDAPVNLAKPPDHPLHANALGRRAESSYQAGDLASALADSSAAIASNPRAVTTYLTRINVLLAQHRKDDALADVARMLADNSRNALAHVIAARVYHKAGLEAQSHEQFELALQIRPEAYIYVNRAESREKGDLAGRKADIDAALQLKSGMLDALVEQAALYRDMGDDRAALAGWTAALAKAPRDPTLLAARGVAHQRLGEEALATADFTAARALATTAMALNNLCWQKATAGVALESALEDCDASLALAPENANARDSRAFVLLRLGRLDDALRDYDRAVAALPESGASLFGRAVAWARKGDTARSKTDLDAALKLDPSVRKTFEEFGVKL